MASSSSEDRVLAVITITKTLTDDEVMIFTDATCANGESLPLVEALGMIELGKDTLLRTSTDL